jgi:hypothetical protein
MNAYFIPAHPGQFEVAVHPEVAVGLVTDVPEVDVLERDEDEVGAAVEVGATVEARQLHALEILAGS